MEIIDSGESIVKKLDYKYLIANNLNRFKDYQCDLGSEGLIIETNGDIYKAYCHVGGLIGNVTKDELEINLAPVVCDQEVCACSVDIEISKRII
jgi:hypothetical protein